MALSGSCDESRRGHQPAVDRPGGVHSALRAVPDGARFGNRHARRITEDDFEMVFGASLTTLAASTWNKSVNTLRMTQEWPSTRDTLTLPGPSPSLSVSERDTFV